MSLSLGGVFICVYMWYICVCICVFVCVCVCVVCVYVCVCGVYMCLCAFVYVCVRVFVHASVGVLRSKTGFSCLELELQALISWELYSGAPMSKQVFLVAKLALCSPHSSFNVFLT